MPNLALLALRYTLWLIALRVAYIFFTTATDMPNTLTTLVILSSVPALEIAMWSKRKATDRLRLGSWALILATMMSVYFLLNLIVPAMISPEFRMLLSDPTGLRTQIVVLAAVTAFSALFLWIGQRIKSP